MSSFQASARKYRPSRFDQVIGQDAVVQTLMGALRLGRVSHAYLFCGPRGTGKTTLARLLAKAINCHHPIGGEPCETCPACLEIASGRSLDILEIDGASNRGVDDIRILNETVGYASSSCRYKVYLIDEVHMLTKEAFNALLKTLEEPPANVKFFFATTEPHKVPATIISRCQRFDLRRISPELIAQKLASIARESKIDAEPEALALIADKAEGCLRDALSLFDQLSCFSEGKVTREEVATHFGLPPQSLFAALDKAIQTQDLPSAILLARDIYARGLDIGSTLQELMLHFQRHLHASLKNSSPFPSHQCLHILDQLLSFSDLLSRALAPELLLELCLMRIIQSSAPVSLPSLVDRLFNLEKKLSSAPKAEAAPPKSALRPPEPKIAPPSIEERLLAALTTESPKEAPKQTLEEAPAPEEEVAQAPIIEAPSSKRDYQTLLRFTAVELEGTIQK